MKTMAQGPPRSYSLKIWHYRELNVTLEAAVDTILYGVTITLTISRGLECELRPFAFQALDVISAFFERPGEIRFLP
jgi:hypothetical protein